MITRRRYVVKAKHKQHRHRPEERHEVVQSGPTSLGRPHPVTGHRQVHPRHARPRGQVWKTAGMIGGAILFGGLSIYLLAAMQWGRSAPELLQQAPSLPLPTSPGHRSAIHHVQQAGTFVEHSLADRPPPTEQGFINAFGGPHTGMNPGQLSGSDKIPLQGRLSGNCDIGKDGGKDVQDCLERHSVK